jgi:hypothetical protein
MGLDIYIEKVSDYRTDEKGRTVSTKTQLGNLRGCSNFLDELNHSLDGGFGSGATYSFCEGKFLAIRKTLIEELANAEKKLESKDFSDLYRFSDEDDEKFNKRNKEYIEDKIKQLKFEIKSLDEFFKENNIEVISDEKLEELIEDGEEDCYGEEFEVSASW